MVVQRLGMFKGCNQKTCQDSRGDQAGDQRRGESAEQVRFISQRLSDNKGTNQGNHNGFQCEDDLDCSDVGGESVGGGSGFRIVVLVVVHIDCFCGGLSSWLIIGIIAASAV